MPDPRITNYSQEDQEGFATLVKDVHEEFGFEYDPELDQDLDDPEARYAFITLLKAGDAVVGSAALTVPRSGVATVKRMYLRPEFRAMGWGRRLLEEVVDHATSCGCERIDLDTSTRQAGARRLYEKSGFTLLRQEGEILFYTKDLRVLAQKSSLTHRP